MVGRMKAAKVGLGGGAVMSGVCRACDVRVGHVKDGGD